MSAPSPGSARPPQGVQENLGAARRFLMSPQPSRFASGPPRGCRKLGATRRFPMKALPAIPRFPGLQRGVTLVELLIALALSLAVLVGLSAVYVASKQSFKFQETAGRLQEDGAYALETIARDLRMAGFAGCRGVDTSGTAPAITYYPSLGMSAGSPGGISGPNPLAVVESTNAAVLVQPLAPQNFLRGFDAVPAAMFATAPVSSTTDSLFFSGASSNAVSLSAAMAAASDPLTIASDPFGWGADVYNMVVADCTSSSLFAGQVAGGGTQIAHTTAITSASTGANAASNFPLSPVYGVDAIVMPLEWNFYYVATRAGASTPSLYRVFFNGTARGAAQELVANVESMKLNYGENTTNDVTTGAPTMHADIWRTTAAAVTDWSRVVAVRVGLMMVSEDNTANRDVTTAVPTLLGQAYTPPAGASMTRLRKEFSTTVVLRNRVAAR